jgi:SAM-dependent methyltransferase
LAGHFRCLPLKKHQHVLDLGCGVGDQAAELVRRGAYVVGVDFNEDVLAEARARDLREAEFVQADLRRPPEFGRKFDGLWAALTAAYFTDLPAVLCRWAEHLSPNAWLALVEIDDFFGHEPLLPQTREFLEAYARDALIGGRYDFWMGRKLADRLGRAGFRVTRAFTVPDKELSFDGPAGADVIEAWRERLDGMRLLQEACGDKFAAIRDDFLACLPRADHRSLAKVYCCIAELNGP